VRTHRLLQLSLPILAFLVACGETPNLRSTEVAGDSSTINGSIAASKAVDVDLESTLPVMRIQLTPGSNRLRAKATTSTDAFNALLSLKGMFVVAVNANGQVLGSSPIADDGSFSVSSQKNQTVALMFANKGTNGAWVCQQPLEYNDGTGAQTAILNPSGSQIQAGRFSFKAATGRASSSSDQASVTPVNDTLFSNDSLDGYQRCGNPNVEEIVVKGDYNITWPTGLNANDPVRNFNRTMVLGLDTSTSGKPRFVGAGTVNADGKLELRVRHEAGSSVKLSPTIVDERSFEALSGTTALMPTWNMGIPASDVSQQSDFGAINAEIVQAKGDVLASNDTAQVGASVSATLESQPGSIAQSLTMTSESSKVGEGGAFNLLVPKPNDPEAIFDLKVVSLDKLETVHDVIQPGKSVVLNAKRLKTQPVNGLRTHQFGTAADDAIHAMTLEGQNLIVVGETEGISATPANLDTFVRKYSPTGQVLWHKRFGTSGIDDTAVAVLARSDGTLLVVSQKYSGTQSFLTKLDSSGNILWLQNLVISGLSQINIASLTQAANGDVYAAGWSKNATGNSGHDGLLLKYSNASLNQSSGPAPLWNINLSSSGNNTDEIRGLTLDANQNLVAVGATDGELETGHQVGSTDIFIARYVAADLGGTTAPNGAMIHQVGTNSNDETTAIASDSSGNVYVTGFTGGGSSGPPRLSGFLQKFDTNLMPAWMSTVVTSDGTDATSLGLSVDQSSIYVAGRTDGPIGGSGNFAGVSDITVARYESDGGRSWLKQFGTAQADQAQSVVVRNARVIVGGLTSLSLHGQISFGQQDAVTLDLATNGN
jgi:Beta-propeller repeat